MRHAYAESFFEVFRVDDETALCKGTSVPKIIRLAQTMDFMHTTKDPA